MALRHPTDDELNGDRLYGDDFGQDEVAEWFEDERNAYANLGSADRATYAYSYHALNMRHGFRHLPRRRFEEALGVGSAYGDEFSPIADRVGRVTIVEPSPELREVALRIPVEYRDPALTVCCRSRPGLSTSCSASACCITSRTSPSRSRR